MLIGHLPAGYITAKLLHPALFRNLAPEKRFIAWSMLGAWAPDVDMLYFYCIDHRQHLHHSYFTHYPLFWLALLASSIVWLKARPGSGALAFVFCLGGMGHMLLDTIVGDIWWLAPFDDRPYSLFKVPAGMHPWWLNFVCHWSFALELGLVFVALYVFKRSGTISNPRAGVAAMPAGLASLQEGKRSTCTSPRRP